MFTTSEAAEELGITRGDVRRLCIEGEIVAEKHGRDWAIPEPELKRFTERELDPRGRPRVGSP